MHLFYEQSGAMVFFLLHRAGPEVRERFIEYMEKVYMGLGPGFGAKQMGYTSWAALDKAFKDFLRSTR
jgi:hypothetical protein